jgi:hypothetical protein
MTYAEWEETQDLLPGEMSLSEIAWNAGQQALRDFLARELEAQETRYEDRAREMYHTTLQATREYRYGYASGLREGFRNAAHRVCNSRVDAKEVK